MIFWAHQSFIMLACANGVVDALHVKVASDETASSPSAAGEPSEALISLAAPTAGDVLAVSLATPTAGDVQAVKQIFDEAGSRENVKQLLDYPFQNMENVQKPPVSLVWLAGRFGHFEVVRFLVGAGANARDAWVGMSHGRVKFGSSFDSKINTIRIDFKIVDALLPYMQNNFDGLPRDVKGLILPIDSDSLIKGLGLKGVPEICVQKILEFCPPVPRLAWGHVFNFLDELVVAMSEHPDWLRNMQQSYYWRYKLLEYNLQQLLEKADPDVQPFEMIFTRKQVRFRRHATAGIVTNPSREQLAPASFTVIAKRDDGRVDESDDRFKALKLKKNFLKKIFG